MFHHHSGLHHFSRAGPHSGASSMLDTDTHHYSPAQHQRVASGGNLVGKPIHFTVGQFADKAIRAELHELQAATFGRKYGQVDRRPLDPPPVVQLRLFQVVNAGTKIEREVEIDYDNIHILGFICTVELLRAAPPEALPAPDSVGNSLYSLPPQSPNEVFSFGSQVSPIAGYAEERTTTGSPEGPVHKAAAALSGTTFVEAKHIPWNGRTRLLFTFADLAVKSKGYFIPRYRFFDLFSKPAYHAEQLIQADCFGARFRIYPSKDAPCLAKSTELSKVNPS